MQGLAFLVGMKLGSEVSKRFGFLFLVFHLLLDFILLFMFVLIYNMNTLMDLLNMSG